MGAKILIIDDDQRLCICISDIIQRQALEAHSAHTLAEGLKALSETPYEVIFLDVRLPDGNGLEALPGILKLPHAPDVIIITGEGDPNGAELAITCGAWDYVEKPFAINNIKLTLLRCLQYRKEKAGQKPSVALRREGIIGSSPPMRQCFDILAQAASVDAHVLITGETGTGKELFAQAIHENSQRRNKNFVVVDCAALPDTLVESILFGHVKGAFTGAERTREGLIRQANGGTLFLDEVGELPMPVQKIFLRVLQEQTFRPVGSDTEKKSDFRLIAATNQDLEAMVEKGKFRKDLLFRLRSISLELPPLRERGDDIQEIALKIINKLCQRYAMETKGFSTDFAQALERYEWPGNVRELAHAIDNSLAAAGIGPTLYSLHLPLEIRAQSARLGVQSSQNKQAAPGPGDEPAPEKEIPPIKTVLDQAERQYLIDLLRHTRGDMKALCRISGLSRSRLYARLSKYGISRKND